MSLDSVSDWSTTAASNIDVAGINIQGSASIANGDNALRAIMAGIASYTRRGSDLASAGTLNLDSIDSLLLNVTGTTTVTAVTLTSGHWRIVRATGAFQMTAGASLIVNGSTSVNYTTVAGDYLLFEGYGSSVVRVSVIGYGGAATLIQPVLTLKQGSSPTPTAEGAIEWDTDDDTIVIGDGSGQKLFRPNGGRVTPAAITTTSGTSHDVTGLPSTIRRIIFTFTAVSTSGTSPIMIQIGDSGGLETSSYVGAANFLSEAPATSIVAFTSGFLVASAGAAGGINNGVVVLERNTSNVWGCHGTTSRTDVDIMNFTSGYKTLSAELDRFRITTLGGTETFDAGAVYYAYEY